MPNVIERMAIICLRYSVVRTFISYHWMYSMISKLTQLDFLKREENIEVAYIYISDVLCMYNHGNGEHKIQNWPKVLLLHKMRLNSIRGEDLEKLINQICSSTNHTFLGHVAIELSILGRVFFFSYSY